MGKNFHIKRFDSKDVAKQRLKVLLVSDRASCSVDVLDAIQNDIIDVIKKYLDITEDECSVQISQQKREGNIEYTPVIHVTIPINDMTHNSK